MPLVEILNKINRPFVLVCMAGSVIYLALTGHEPAMQALISQFVAISSFSYGAHVGAQAPQQVVQQALQERREG
jgi:hypothetical protein